MLRARLGWTVCFAMLLSWSGGSPGARVGRLRGRPRARAQPAEPPDASANGDECLLGGMFVGGGIGVATAMILDWSLGWEKSVVSPPVGGKPARVALTGAGFAPTANGFNLVLGGRF